METYTIYLGADHRGFTKKNQLFDLLKDCHENVLVEDLGADELNPEDDFNDPAIAVAKAVQNNPNGFGVLVCASAHGVTMQANRFKGVRAINALTPESAGLGRADDYANVVCLSADQLDVEAMERVVKTFCHTQPKSDPKYLRRMQKLDQIED